MAELIEAAEVKLALMLIRLRQVRRTLTLTHI